MNRRMPYVPDSKGGPRTLLAGAIGPTIVRLDLRSRTGQVRAVPFALDRSFVVVSPGKQPFRGAALVATDD